MALGQFFLGQPSRVEQIQRFNPQQQNIMQLLNQMGIQGLQDPYQGFNPIEEQARRGFEQQTIPSLAERFTSTGGALSSPSFASQLGQAGAGLEGDLAAMRSQYGMQNRAQALQQLGLGLTPQFENYGVGAEPGMLQRLLPSLGQLATGVGSAALNPAGSVRSALSEILKLMSGGNR